MRPCSKLLAVALLVLTAMGFPVYDADARAAEERVSPVRTELTRPEEPVPQTVPWGVSRIGAHLLHRWTAGEGVRIGLLDSGVTLDHPDLAGAVRGAFDFTGLGGATSDEFGHGTHLGGIIAGIDDEIGIVGVAPGAEIYSLKVIDGLGRLHPDGVARAIEWAIENQMDILNLSFRATDQTPIEPEIFDRAAAAGIIMISSAGNRLNDDEPEELAFPASHPAVISVGATMPEGTAAPFSQRDSRLDFSAPGSEIFSTEVLFTSGLTLSDGSRREAKLVAWASEDDVAGRLVSCGRGFPGECPPEVKGEIALIERGESSFAEKAKTAMDAGALAIVFYNHHPDDHPEGGVILASFGEESDWPVAIFVSNSTGRELVKRIEEKIWIGSHRFSVWGARSGTSMAAAHVTGAFALLRALAPEASRETLLGALIESSRDLGDPGPDPSHGFGEIDVYGAARLLAPELFPVRRRGFGR